MESPHELRAVCQKGKESGPGWYFAHRRVSIYLTWALLHARIAPNEISVLMMLVGTLGAACLAVPAAALNIVGFPLLYLSFLLDKVDGEIARYRGTVSMRGMMLDRVHHLMVEPLALIAAGGREYMLSGSLSPVIAALVAVLAGNLVDEHQHLAPYIFFKHLKSGASRPAGGSRGSRRGLDVLAGVFRPLKAFRLFITVVPSLALAYTIQALMGWPAVRWYLWVAAAGLGVMLVFQSLYYYARKLQEEIADLNHMVERRESAVDENLTAIRSAGSNAGDIVSAVDASTNQSISKARVH